MSPRELKCWRFCPSVAHLGGSGTFKGRYLVGGLSVTGVSTAERTVRPWSSPSHHRLAEAWKEWSVCSLTRRNSNPEPAQSFPLCKLMLSGVWFVFVVIFILIKKLASWHFPETVFCPMTSSRGYIGSIWCTSGGSTTFSLSSSLYSPCPKDDGRLHIPREERCCLAKSRENRSEIRDRGYGQSCAWNRTFAG